MTSRTRHRRSPTALALAIAVLFALTGTALAHAELVAVSPETDSTIEGAPGEIAATFTEDLLADGSGIRLRDAAGVSVAAGDVDADDPTRLVITDLPALTPGAYEVRWTAATDDGHIERGTWTFTVEAAASAAPTATTTPSGAPSDPRSDPPSDGPSDAPTAAPSASAPEPTPDASGGEEPASSTGDVLIPIIVLVALVGIGGAYFLRRRSGPAA